MKLNELVLVGTVSKKSEFSHEAYNEKFNKLTVTVARPSGACDKVDVIYPAAFKDFEVGQVVRIEGSYRSRNAIQDGKRRLILFAFADTIKVTDEVEHVNNLRIVGYICKKPTYRTTPLGREICDLTIACNRPTGQSDYIQSISWGRNARLVDTFEIGTKIVAEGRVQSREYGKKVNDDDYEQKTAYEFSINKIEPYAEV